MDKNTLCNVVRSSYPEMFGIRKKMQRIKINRLYRYTLPEDITSLCEKDPLFKEKIVNQYKTKWEKPLRPIISEMEDIMENAKLYKNRPDKNLLRLDILFCKMAYGFLPSEYIGFNLENKSTEERKEFVSDLDTNVFGYSVNNIRILQKIIEKGQSAVFFKELFKRDFVVIKKSEDYDKFIEFIDKHPVFVEKKVFSSMGKGTRLVDSNAFSCTLKEYFLNLISNGKYLLEELVIQNNEMARYNSTSVNTIRCITLKTKNDVIIPYCFLRVGRNGSFVDNGGAGGILVGVNPRNGELFTDGYDEYRNIYKKHPDNEIEFKGKYIPSWNDLITLCKTQAKEVDEIAYLSWDLAYTESGWVVIEVNEVGQFIGPQIVMQKGIKKDLINYYKSIEAVI